MRIIGYLQDSTSDGEGLRDVVFFSGCEHLCAGCHNPESWDSSLGIPLSNEMVSRIIQNCKRLSPPAITLSGGDPLHSSNYKDVLLLCKKLKSNNINIWLYTGYTLAEVEEKFPDILLLIDTIVDGKFDRDKKEVGLMYRGSTNQVITKLSM